MDTVPHILCPEVWPSFWDLRVTQALQASWIWAAWHPTTEQWPGCKRQVSAQLTLVWALVYLPDPPTRSRPQTP